jgi:hypothetical protein
MPANERDKEREGERKWSAPRERDSERKNFRGKKKVKTRESMGAKRKETLFSPPQILHSSLAALWYGAAAAPPVFIGSSLHLPIFLFSFSL